MILGIDVSTYFEELEHGAKYYNGNVQIEPLDEFVKNGVSCMRIRVWVNPYGAGGEPYLAGNCDLNNFIKLAKFAQSKGYDILLDLHYSDFWADPSKQYIPKAWKERSVLALSTRVYNYTTQTLLKAKSEGISIKYIQVGNEITNGMLWPVGRLTENPDGTRGNYKSLIQLLNAGISACREQYPSAEIILHLERSHDIAVYNEFFGNMQAYGVDYDIIGTSYYPYWHGTFEQYFANMVNVKKFGKKIFTVELGYAFTLEDYIKNEHGGAKLVVGENNVDSFGFTQAYPITPQGQAQFTESFLKLSNEHGIQGVFWWEPLWIPGDGICWASVAGQEYINETGKSTRNEWANQCLFDYNGKKLPAFDKFKIPDKK